jgi:hypothetical protein
MVVALAFVLPSTASASSITFEPEASRAWTLRTLASYHMPLPPGDLVIHRGPCFDGGGACALSSSGGVWAQGRFALAHELGHVFDTRVLTPSDRAWFTQLLDLTGRPWGASGGWPDPAERFADAYAACAVGLSPAGKRDRKGRVRGGWIDVYGCRPTARQHRAICNAISESALRDG